LLNQVLLVSGEAMISERGKEQGEGGEALLTINQLVLVHFPRNVAPGSADEWPKEVLCSVRLIQEGFDVLGQPLPLLLLPGVRCLEEWGQVLIGGVQDLFDSLRAGVHILTSW